MSQTNDIKRPNFFIVGAPKSGTTALYHYLKQHPEIFMSEVKEPHFFGTDLVRPFSIRNEQEYLSLFSKARNAKRVGEASVGYLLSKRAALEIKKFCPSARIIIMLRNPVDMIYAGHSELVYGGVEDILDFEAALNAEEDRRRGLRVPVASHFPGEAFLYREAGRYSDKVKRYLDVFGRESVQIIIFDDFITETSRIYRQTCQFLGVSSQFEPRFEIINPNKIVRNRILGNFLNSPALRRLARGFMPFAARRVIGRSLLRLNTRYEPRPPMPLELRRRLQAEFAPEVEQLSRLLGRDLTYWCRPATESLVSGSRKNLAPPTKTV
jgi:hypothetical protein